MKPWLGLLLPISLSAGRWLLSVKYQDFQKLWGNGTISDEHPSDTV